MRAQVCPKDFKPTLLQHIDADNLPEYLGGRSKATLLDDAGPWNDTRLLEQIEADLHVVTTCFTYCGFFIADGYDVSL